jgi:hypothetical protein
MSAVSFALTSRLALVLLVTIVLGWVLSRPLLLRSGAVAAIGYSGDGQLWVRCQGNAQEYRARLAPGSFWLTSGFVWLSLRTEQGKHIAVLEARALDPAAVRAILRLVHRPTRRLSRSADASW